MLRFESSTPRVYQMCYFFTRNKKRRYMLYIPPILGSGGFGVPVANILFAPSTPACAFPGTSMYRHERSRLRLGIISGALRFESSTPRVYQMCYFFARNKKRRYILHIPPCWGVKDLNLRRLSQQIYSHSQN